jgi:predicted RNA-binding Zn-ribbon protein involved in translation (DUF1610 family)
MSADGVEPSQAHEERAGTEPAEPAPPPLPPFPCPNCGAEVVDAEREGDWVCAECGEIHLDRRSEERFSPRSPTMPKADAEESG